jgi:hypothetical protein
VPGAIGAPNTVPITSATRAFARNCPCHRPTASAQTRGPYCTGAAAPTGASALVTCPQPHRREIN